MECIRGFSYMPEQKIDMKLQYIEGEELERTWKTTRRQRVKEREQKIWEDFVKEQDVLSSVCKDDPYQFLEQLPEVCLKELMEVELQKMKKENEIEKLEQEQEEPPAQQGDGDSPRRAEDAPAPPAVTFADDDGSDSDVIHIYDDVKDDDQSGPEDETLNDSPGSPPGTVREKEEKGLAPLSPPLSPDKISSKSSENVTSMIESSIYCAKVRDLRTKINEEIMSIINSLELRERDILGIDPEDLVKMCRRSTEFCARFNRIYMYQLHRQIHDVKRNSGAALPFARHTQFQSQMVRVVSLHHNLLQSLQIFHKSFEQTGCVRESADMLRCLARVAREASDTCRAIPPPPHLAAANDLYTDAVLPACDRLDDTINDFAAKISNYMNSTANTSTSRSKKSQSSRGKKSVGTWSKSGSKNKSMAESRLSMYSLDTLRVTMHPKSSSSKDNQSSAGTSKIGGGVSRRAAAPAPKANTPRKSPRSRRPLMRDAAGTRARGRGVREDNIRTLVEAVEACTSSHISREASPHHSNSNTPRRRNNNANNNNNNNTPAPATPQRSNNASPRKPCISPKKTRRTSPKPAQCLRAALSSIKSADPLATAESSGVHVRPAPACEPPTCVQPARREPVREPESPRPSPRAALSPRQDAAERGEREKTKITNVATNRCEVSRIVRQLCGGDAAGSRNERVLGAKNAQLLCISGTSPRQPSTPQLLRILEETIQKKVPKGLFQKAPTVKNIDRFRLTFNIPDKTAENLFLYRTKFVQHMLASPMYANSIVGKPWEMISSVSEQIIDDLLLQCAEEMQLRDIVQRLYQTETS